MTVEELKQVCVGCPPGAMTAADIRALVKDQQAGNEELDAYVARLRYSRTETESVAKLAQAIQEQFKILFTNQLNANREFNIVGDECDPDKDLVSAWETGASRAWRFISYSTVAVFGRIWTAGGYVVRFVRRAGSYGLHAAEWISRNPRTARLITFIAVQIKNYACVKIG